MSTALKIILVMMGVLTLSVVLTPPLDHLLPMFRFEKIFNRLVMVFTIAAAAFVVRSRKLSWASCGFDFSVPWKRFAAYGFAGGSFLLIAITVIEVIWGPRFVRDPLFASDIAQRFVKGMLSGVVVGIVEEFFFRGFIFNQLNQRMKTTGAVVLASVFYSATHFLDNGQIFIPDDPGMGDAVRLLVGYLEPLAFQFARIWPQFLGLFIFGILLTIAYLRTRSLFFSIGMHAGVVFIIKWQNAFLRKGPDEFHPVFGGTPHYDGLLEWGFLLIMTFFLYWWTPHLPANSHAK